MRLIDMSCPRCGAGLKIDERTTQKIQCKYCGSSFFIEDAEDDGYKFEKGRQKAIRENTKKNTGKKITKKHGRLGLAVILIVVLLICGFIFWKTMLLKDEVDALNSEERSIQEDIEKAKRDQTAITNEIKYRQTDDYIEDQARDIFGLRNADETIFLPGNTEENVTPAVSAEKGTETDGD